jgi:uncharacterized membrane protein (UPF0127 family)
VEKRDGTPARRKCRVAANPWGRMRGLLGRKQLAHGEGLLIRRTRSVHTHFVRFSIDLLFLDGDGRVVRIRESVPPWRIASSPAGRDVLELAAGACRRVGAREGDRLFVVEGVSEAA